MIFKDYHIYPMHIGLKTQTRRLWSRRMVAPFRWYPVTHKMFYQPEDVVGEIFVENIWRQTLVSVTDEQAMCEGGYTRDAYMKVLKEILEKSTPKRPLSLDSILWVVKFRFVLSDIVDPNGGTADIDWYRDRWIQHMTRVQGAPPSIYKTIETGAA